MAKRKRIAERAGRLDIVAEIFNDATCSIVVGATLADAWAYARGAWPAIDAAYDAGDEACVIDVDGQCVMLLAQGPSFAIFAHESVHVAAWISRSRGLQFSLSNEESVAHLVQWVVAHGWPWASTWASQP